MVARPPLDLSDLVEHIVERRRHQAVHLLGIRALDESRRVPVAFEQAPELINRDPREHRRVGDLVAVQVEHRQHRAVARRVQELVRVPARGQRTGLRLTVADHAQRQQVRVVEDRAVGVEQGVSKLTALVDRPRRLGCDVARDSSRERELPEQPAQSLFVARDVGVHLAVGPVEVGARDDTRTAVTGAGHVDRVQAAPADRPVHVDVDEVQPGGRPPVAEQPGFYVLGVERFAEQRVREQVDLADRQVVRGAPPRIHRLELFGGQSGLAGHCLDSHMRGLPDPPGHDVVNR